MNPRIFGAFLVGAGLVSVAYFLAPSDTQRPVGNGSLSAVAEAPKREPIKVVDSDNDGIADWQEQFRRAEPVRVREEELAEEENYTPPETLTGQLAIDLLAGTIQSEIRGPFGQSRTDLMRHAETEIVESVQDELYSLSDINTSPDNDPESLRVYGNHIAAIAVDTTVPKGTRSELEVIEHALRVEDKEILAELEPRIAAYEEMISAMRSTAVPSSVADAHIDLLNTYHALYRDLEGMHKTFEDPLYTMARLKRYRDDALGMHNAIVNLYTRLHEEGARFSEVDRALDLVTIEE